MDSMTDQPCCPKCHRPIAPIASARTLTDEEAAQIRQFVYNQTTRALADMFKAFGSIMEGRTAAKE
jgi:hypothetical protein